MYLKVQLESKVTVVYRLTAPEVLIGSAPTNHVVISASFISKKHLKLIKSDETWFVVDQGSTNGSFINKEKLIPGQRIKFDLDTTINLSEKVSLNLLAHSDNALDLKVPEVKVETAATPKSSDQDKTQVISLTDLRSLQAVSEQKKKKENLEKKAKEDVIKSIERKKTTRNLLIALGFMVGVASLNYYLNADKRLEKDLLIKKLEENTIKKTDALETGIEGFKISTAALLTRNDLTTHLLSPKCNQPETAEICTRATLYNKNNNGVIFSQASLIFYLEEKEWLSNAGLKVLEPSEPEVMKKLAFMTFLEDELAAAKLNPDSKIYVVFYKYDANKVPALTNVAALKSNYISFILDDLKKENLMAQGADLKQIVQKFDLFYSFY